jgi:single-stranded DNA-binding protein
MQAFAKWDTAAREGGAIAQLMTASKNRATVNNEMERQREREWHLGRAGGKPAQRHRVNGLA